MNTVFADTFYWIAFTNAQDEAHARAKKFTFSAKPGAIYTTEEVLTGYLNYFVRGTRRASKLAPCLTRLFSAFATSHSNRLRLSYTAYP